MDSRKKSLKVKRKVFGKDDAEVKRIMRRIDSTLNDQVKQDEAAEFSEGDRQRTWGTAKSRVGTVPMECQKYQAW